MIAGNLRADIEWATALCLRVFHADVLQVGRLIRDALLVTLNDTHTN